MRFILFLSLIAPLSLKAESDLKFLESFRLGQAILDKNIHAYRIEIEKMLEDPAFDFYIAASALSYDTADSVFELMKGVPPPKEGEDKEIKNFPKEGRNLMIAMTPPLGKRNKMGQTALELAKAGENHSAYDILLYYNNKAAYEMVSGGGSSEDLWERNIHLKKLEDTSLGRALIKEDFNAFQKEIKKMILGRAGEFISLLHSTTAKGESLFHLLANVKTNQVEFSMEFEKIFILALPDHLKSYITANIKLTEKDWMSRISLAGYYFGPAVMVMAGAAFESAGIASHNGWLLTGGVILQAGGIAGLFCKAAFKKNK